MFLISEFVCYRSGYCWYDESRYRDINTITSENIDKWRRKLLYRRYFSKRFWYIYMYINRIIDVDWCQESIGRISEKYTVILEIDFSFSFARRIKKLFITTSLLVSVCETVWTNFLLCDHTSICILSREKWDDAHFSLDDKQIKGLLETHRCVLVEFVGKVIKTTNRIYEQFHDYRDLRNLPLIKTLANCFSVSS